MCRRPSNALGPCDQVNYGQVRSGITRVRLTPVIQTESLMLAATPAGSLVKRFTCQLWDGREKIR